MVSDIKPWRAAPHRRDVSRIDQAFLASKVFRTISDNCLLSKGFIANSAIPKSFATAAVIFSL
jgi:hypothetical protein